MNFNACLHKSLENNITSKQWPYFLAVNPAGWNSNQFLWFNGSKLERTLSCLFVALNLWSHCKWTHTKRESRREKHQFLCHRTTRPTPESSKRTIRTSISIRSVVLFTQQSANSFVKIVLQVLLSTHLIRWLSSTSVLSDSHFDKATKKRFLRISWRNRNRTILCCFGLWYSAYSFAYCKSKGLEEYCTGQPFWAHRLSRVFWFSFQKSHRSRMLSQNNLFFIVHIFFIEMQFVFATSGGNNLFSRNRIIDANVTISNALSI